MHIHCPSCAAVYDLPVILLTSSRTMRCAVCAQDWQTTAIDPETAQAIMRGEAQESSAVVPPSPTQEAAQVLAAAAAQVVTQVAAKMLAAPDGLGVVAHEAPNDNADIADVPRVVEQEEVPGTSAMDQPPATDEPPSGPSQPMPAPRRSRLTRLLHGTTSAVVGWVFSLSILFVCGHAAVEYRAGIMGAWPPSRRLFLWLGLS